MGKQETDWAVGDNCFLIVSISKRYIQEFEVQGFNGNYYTVKRGNYLHHVAPSRMFRTKDEALASLDTREIPTVKNTEKTNEDSFRKLTQEELAEEQETQDDGMDEDSSPVMGM